jgi:hypothetical protein
MEKTTRWVAEKKGIGGGVGMPRRRASLSNSGRRSSIPAGEGKRRRPAGRTRGWEQSDEIGVEWTLED